MVLGVSGLELEAPAQVEHQLEPAQDNRLPLRPVLGKWAAGVP